MKLWNAIILVAIGGMSCFAGISALPSSAHAQSDFRYAFANVDPSQGPVEQALGFYSNGTLQNAMALPASGDGFLKLFPTRDRGWGTFDLHYVLTYAASRVKSEMPGSEPLQVGDIANRFGGSIGSHASHQNGLDMDVCYLRVNHRVTDVNHNGFDEVFVKNGKLSENFDIARNWQVINFMASTSRVTRIFVDPVIKKAFCDYAKATGQLARSTETLRLMRPWPDHQDHMHVRISCPNNSPRCEKQDPPPAGDSCAEVVNPMMWFRLGNGYTAEPEIGD